MTQQISNTIYNGPEDLFNLTPEYVDDVGRVQLFLIPGQRAGEDVENGIRQANVSPLWQFWTRNDDDSYHIMDNVNGVHGDHALVIQVNTGRYYLMMGMDARERGFNVGT